MKVSPEKMSKVKMEKEEDDIKITEEKDLHLQIKQTFSNSENFIRPNQKLRNSYLA